MHTLFLRCNTVFTFSLMLLAGLCSIASYSDRLHRSNPIIELDVAKYHHFWKLPGGPLHGNDEVVLSLNIKADLRSVFTWNTKQLFVFICAEYSTPKNSFNQVSLWDTIIVRKEDAVIDLTDEHIEYGLIDQGNHLKGRPFNLTMFWSKMPIAGGLETQKKVFTGFTLPSEYS